MGHPAALSIKTVLTPGRRSLWEVDPKKRRPYLGRGGPPLLISSTSELHFSYVGVPHDVELDGEELFFSHVHLHGGPAPVRRFLPKPIDLVWTEMIHPGKVFDLALPLDQVAEGYRAMDERRAIKAILQP